MKTVSRGFLAPANRTPTLVDNVQVFDSLAGTYLSGQSVLIADGKVAKLGAAGTVKAHNHSIYKKLGIENRSQVLLKYTDYLERSAQEARLFC